MNTTKDSPPGDQGLAFQTYALQMILFGPFYERAQHCCGSLRIVSLQCLFIKLQFYLLIWTKNSPITFLIRNKFPSISKKSFSSTPSPITKQNPNKNLRKFIRVSTWTQILSNNFQVLSKISLEEDNYCIHCQSQFCVQI